MKVLAMYLPQYHAIPENDAWWGGGYTEWTAVKNAKPLYKGHKEPRVPLNNNYYDLSDESGKVWQWQADLANKYGIYGFCIYHYWFCGKQLLQKPMEILLKHPEININYCICWANETWRRNWYGQESTILMEQTYGDETAWTNHFNYLNAFFQDSRYIKIDNRPLVNIYHSNEIECLPEMLALWNKLAKQNGFDGIYIVSGMTSGATDHRENIIDAYYMFEPGYTLRHDLTQTEKINRSFKTALKRYCNRIFKTNFVENIIDIQMIYSHIEKRNLQENIYPATFPQWDNTPRTGTMGLSYIGSSPKLFKTHLDKLKDKYVSRGFLYINAWNEWGEGAYLEPDEEYKYEYLTAIKESVL